MRQPLHLPLLLYLNKQPLLLLLPDMPQVWIPTRLLWPRPQLPLRFRELTVPHLLFLALVLQATAQRVTEVEATSRLAISALATELREATVEPHAATVESSSSVATEPSSSSSVAMVVSHSSAATAVSSSSAAMVDSMAVATSSVATRAVTSVATTEQAFM